MKQNLKLQLGWNPKDPWLGMAIEKQFKKLLKEPEQMTPSVILSLEENRHRVAKGSQAGVDAAINELFGELNANNLTKTLSKVLWPELTLKQAMKAKIRPIDLLTQLVNQYESV